MPDKNTIGLVVPDSSPRLTQGKHSDLELLKQEEADETEEAWTAFFGENEEALIALSEKALADDKAGRTRSVEDVIASGCKI